MAKINYELIIPLIVLASVIFIIVGALFEGGEFEISRISNLEEKVPVMFKLMVSGLAVFIAYGVTQKFYFKSSMNKKDVLSIIISGVALYIIWTEFLTSGQISKLTEITASLMSATGYLP